MKTAPVRRAAVTVVVALGLLTSACATSSSPASVRYSLGHFPEVPAGSFPQSTVAVLQAVIDAGVKQGLPGVAATILTADGQAWSGAAGTSDGQHPVVARSQFAIASITKTVIASEIMWLSEEGSLRLSDPISKHLPASFQFDSNGATIENLLAMESGIPDPAYSPSDLQADPLREWTAQEKLATVPADRSEPGAQFVYADANYMLLGLVIQETTGMSVAASLRSHILADPRLSSMVYQPEERPEGPLALPFLAGRVRSDIINRGGGYLPSKAWASSANGSGCMASDAGALALFGYLLFGGKLLTTHSLLAMTNFKPAESDDRYGLGVFDETKIGAGFRAQAIGNGGWHDAGYSSVLSVLPSKGIVISVMTNTSGDPKALVIPIAQALASSLQTHGKNH